MLLAIAFDINKYLPAIQTFVVFIVLPYLIPWMKAHAASAKATAADVNLSIKDRIKAALEQFLLETAGDLASQKLPELATKLKTGQINTQTEVRAEVDGWLQALKASAVAHFNSQDIDLLKNLGDSVLNKMVQTASTSIVAKQGTEIERVVKPVLDVATNGVAAEHCQACVPPCGTCPLNQHGG